MMNVPEHLDPETIYELVEGRLDAAREGAAEAHLLRCARCREVRESCETTRGALRWFGTWSPAAPAGYWDGFWSRWPLPGDVGAARRSRLVPALATAATILFAAGNLWWAIDRRPLEPADRLASPGPSLAAVARAPGPEPPARELVAGTSWEGDIEVLERVTFAVGSVDPLSKGMALTSLVEEP